MDPLSIQMTLGSPNMLRGRVSFSNLTGRKKKSPESDKSNTSKTPTRLAKIDENLPTTPSRPDTVRTRRGFRPLSVLTTSALVPFGVDTLKAFEELKEGEKETLTDGMALSTEEETPRKISEASRATIPDPSTALSALPFSNESELSLRTFLAHSSPLANDTRVIAAPFSALSQIPAPDLSQHPAFASNPFISQSDAPSLTTTSTPEEIKRVAGQARSGSSRHTDRTSSGSDVFGSADKKRLTIFQKVQSPTSSTRLTSSNSAESSPLAKRQPKSRPIEVAYPNLDSPNSDTEKKRVGSGGFRKISGIFKPRNSAEKQTTSSPTLPTQSPSSTIKELENYLRKVTYSPTYQYTDNSWLPRHPNTGRFWRSRNLKCTNCVNVCCAVCRRACCAFKAAVMALETHKHNPEGREKAVERIQQITTVFPYGRETPTFLQCTIDVSSGAGCGKLVCPDCCGVCPDEACADIQCQKCKRNPWTECGWHSNSTQWAGLGDAVGVRHTV